MTIAEEILVREHVKHMIRVLERDDWKQYVAETALLYPKRQEFALSLQAMHEMYLDLWKQLDAAKSKIRDQQIMVDAYKQEVLEIIKEFKDERKFEKHIQRIDPSTGDIKQ